jgi:hypothetical protein
MTRESLPAGYAITYLPSRAILWTPDCREIGVDIDTAYRIMIASINGDESAIVAECERIERSH